MRKMKTNSGVWVIIMIVLFSVLGVYTMYYFSKQPYIELEFKIADVVKKNSELLTDNKSSIIKIDSEKFKHLIDMEANDEKCAGYVNVYNVLSIKIYKGFIKCGDFESIGYKN